MIKKMSFPPSFDTKVDMRKVELAVMKPWIAKKTVELLGFEDDVLIEYISSLLEDTESPVSDGPRRGFRIGVAAVSSSFHPAHRLSMERRCSTLLRASYTSRLPPSCKRSGLCCSQHSPTLFAFRPSS